MRPIAVIVYAPIVRAIIDAVAAAHRRRGRDPPQAPADDPRLAA